MGALNLAAPILSMYHRFWLVICSCLRPLEWIPGHGLCCTANMFPWLGADCTSYKWKPQENCLYWNWWVSLLCIHVFWLYSFFMYLFCIWSNHLCGAIVPVCQRKCLSTCSILCSTFWGLLHQRSRVILCQWLVTLRLELVETRDLCTLDLVLRLKSKGQGNSDFLCTFSCSAPPNHSGNT